MNKKLIITFILIFLIFTNLAFAKSMTYESRQNNCSSKSDKWTVMYYMCCDSYMYEYAGLLLENLTKIGSTKDMNLVVLYDGKLDNDSYIYYINKLGKKIILNHDLNWPDEVDMNKPLTFELFCKDIMEYYPAEHYAFITYASGATGWQLYPMDDKDGLGDITIPKFAQSLKNITQDGKNKLDVLQTSCCMSSIELAYEIYPYVDYLVTTQEHITSHRIIQRHYLSVKDLHDNTSMSPEEFSTRAIKNHIPQKCNYWESYGYTNWEHITNFLDQIPLPGFNKVLIKTSVTALNLSKIEKLVENAQNLSSYLLSHSQDNEIRNIVTAAWKDTRKFGRATSFHPFINFLYSTFPFKLLPYNPANPINKMFRSLSYKMQFLYIKMPIEILAYNCRLDLYHFTMILKNKTNDNYLKDLLSEIQQGVNETVIDIKKVKDDHSYGINIYFPRGKNSYNKYIDGGKSPIIYETLKFSKDTNWDDFLKSYYN